MATAGNVSRERFGRMFLSPPPAGALRGWQKPLLPSPTAGRGSAPLLGGHRVSPFPSLGDSSGWRAPSSLPSKPRGAGQTPGWDWLGLAIGLLPASPPLVSPLGCGWKIHVAHKENICSAAVFAGIRDVNLNSLLRMTKGPFSGSASPCEELLQLPWGPTTPGGPLASLTPEGWPAAHRPRAVQLWCTPPSLN